LVVDFVTFGVSVYPSHRPASRIILRKIPNVNTLGVISVDQIDRGNRNRFVRGDNLR